MRFRNRAEAGAQLGERVAEGAGRDVVLADVGLAAGVAAEAELRSLKGRPRDDRPGRVLLAVPVAARGTAERLSEVAGEVVVLHLPALFLAVGEWYRDFTPTA